MSKLYNRLRQLSKELESVKTDEEREEIEDEIANIEFEIEEEENAKYNDYGSDEDF